MRAYFVEVFADSRPIYTATVQCSNEATAMARAMRDARGRKVVKRTDTHFVCRAKKLEAPKPVQPE